MEKLGIQPVALIAQIVNFLVLFLLLKKFLYAPILKVLEERRKKISESLEKAKKIDEEIMKIEEKRAQELEKTRAEVRKIIEEAKQNAQDVKSEVAEQALKEVSEIKKRALANWEEEKKKMMEEFKAQTAWLVISITKQVLKQSLDEKRQRELIKGVLVDMEKISGAKQ